MFFPVIPCHCTYCILCIGPTFFFSFVALLVGLWEKKKTFPPAESESVPAPDNKKAKCEYEASSADTGAYQLYRVLIHSLFMLSYLCIAYLSSVKSKSMLTLGVDTITV